MIHRLWPCLLLIACSGEAEKNNYYNSTPCTDGQHRCSVAKIQICTNGAWQQESDCAASSQTCELVAGAPQCVTDTSCTSAQSGNQRCNEDLTWVEQCNGSQWLDAANCGAQNKDCVQTALATAECQSPPPCSPGAMRCRDNYAQTCNNSGLWNVGTNCLDKTCVVASTTSAVCSACTQASGEYQICSGDSLVACTGTTESSALDCTNLTGSDPVNGSCYDGPSSDATCILSSGDICAYNGADDTTYVFPCGTSGGPSASMGCDWANGCGTGLGTCTVPTSGSFAQRCSGGNLILNCLDQAGVAQPFGLRCADADPNNSPTCDSGASVCRQAAAGGACQPGVLECFAGSTCSATAGTWGTCSP
jgi:hypothetical protein